MGNTFKTAFLLTALTLLLMFFGRYFGGQNGMMLALVFAAVMNFVSYFYSDKIALAMYRAQPVTREELPRAYAAVERLTQKIGLPMPKIYVIPTESPNAFATGRNPQHASVAVTHGILGLLTDEELEGVLAHELGHVGNRDILISSVAATIAGCNHHAGQHGTLCHDLWRDGWQRPRRAWRRRTWCPVDADSGSNCGQPDSVGCFAIARIPGRRHGRTLHGQSLCPRKRIAKAGRLFETGADGRVTVDRTSVHYPTAPGDELWQLVFHSSANRQKNRTADGPASRFYAVTPLLASSRQRCKNVLCSRSDSEYCGRDSRSRMVSWKPGARS